MKSKLTLLLFFVLAGLFAQAQGQGRVFDVRTYGATGDGKTLDTQAINKAIDAAAQAGGGTVFFKAGTYLSYSIHMKSNISLFIDQGATILAADSSLYDAAEPNDFIKYQDFGHGHFHNSLIWGEHLENISILGNGVIYGKGLVREADRRPVGTGNKAISLRECRNVELRDFTILYGGHFGILATGCDNMTIDNLKIDTNRDGMDIDGCKNVKVSNCSVNSPQDDGICLKADYALGRFKDCEDIVITNCIVSGYDTGTMLDATFTHTKNGALARNPTGRIKFGTESSGGFKNITISNCVFDFCRGLALETVDGGLLEDVTITNVTMRNIVNAPIFLRLGSRMRSPEGTPIGELRRINISNFVVYNADPRYGSIISGIPGHDIQDVKLHDIRIYYQGGGTKEQAAVEAPEKENAYPEPNMFGVLPSYGFFIRHVKGLQMDNVEVSYMADDARPAFNLFDVKGAEFNNLKAQHAAGVPIFVLKDVTNFSTFRCKDLKDINLEKLTTKTL